MLQRLKRVARDTLPMSLQVPIRYWYSRMRGYLEPEMDVLADIVEPGDKVVDVGGNRGIYAFKLANMGAEVEVFEPNPECVRILEPWAAKRGVHVHAVAISSSEGEAELRIPIDARGVEHDASATLDVLHAQDSRVETVPLRTLDSFGLRNLVLIKIDVEGHEQSVLEGAAQTIATSRPALLIEIEQRHVERPIADLFRLLEEQNYLGFFLIDDRLHPIAEFDLARHQSMADFESAEHRYHNNFFWFHADRWAAGDYDRVQEHWVS